MVSGAEYEEMSKQYAEYQAARAVRAAVVDRNNILRLQGRSAECQPLSPKPDVPLAPIAYRNGTYEGRLESAEDCPVGCVVKWEPMRW